MALRVETISFLHDLEQSSGRKLNFPDEVGYLLEAARTSQNMRAFEEAIFLAKFVTKTLGVMRRIGVDGEGYDKLAGEFHANLQKASGDLLRIHEFFPDEVRRGQQALFFDLSPESLERLIKLMADLNDLKNWVLDGKMLP